MELDESGVPLVAIGVGGEDPFDDLIGDPNLELEDSATVAGMDGPDDDDVISVDSGDDNGDEEGTGAGTDGAEAGAGAMDTNDNDKDAMIVKDAETEAAENTKANTTVIKSIAILNATVMASMWFLAD